MQLVSHGFAAVDGILWTKQHVRRIVEDDKEVLLAVPLLRSEDLLIETLTHFIAEDVQLRQFVAVVELHRLPLSDDIVQHLAVMDAGDRF